MANSNVVLQLAPGPLFQTVLQTVRKELAAAIGTVAATETDARVVARLMEIGSLLSGALAAAEADSAAKTAPATYSRFGGDKPGTAPGEPTP